MCKKTFEVNGKQISAGACLRLALKKESTSETSRIGRYQDKVKSGTAVQDVNESFSELADLIRASEDPIATIVVTKSKQGQFVALAIVSPDSFIPESGTQPLTEISPNQLKGRTKISGKVIPITASSEEIIWNIQAKSMITIEFFANNATLLNPEYRVLDKDVVGDSTKEQIMEYYVSLKIAEEVLSKLCLEYNKKSSVLPNLSTHPTHVPYSCNSKPILCSIIEDCAPILSSRSAKTEVRDNNIEVRCSVPSCNLIFNITSIRHHSAWHIQYDTNLALKVAVPVTNICGICASGRAMTYTKDAPDGVCPAWLEKV